MAQLRTHRHDDRRRRLRRRRSRCCALCAFAFDGTHFHGAFANAGSVASGSSSRLGPAAGVLFAIVLLNASLLGAGIVTLSTSYAIGDVTGVKHSLHRRWRDAPVFHGSFAISVALAAGVALVPHAPLGLLTIAVQALAAVLLPSAAIFSFCSATTKQCSVRGRIRGGSTDPGHVARRASTRALGVADRHDACSRASASRLWRSGLPRAWSSPWSSLQSQAFVQRRNLGSPVQRGKGGAGPCPNSSG